MYVVYVPSTLTYIGVSCVLRRDQNMFLDMFKIYQRTGMRAIRINVTHTLNTLKVRYPYVINTLLIRW